jgi:hypothetical protein
MSIQKAKDPRPAANTTSCQSNCGRGGKDAGPSKFFFFFFVFRFSVHSNKLDPLRAVHSIHSRGRPLAGSAARTQHMRYYYAAALLVTRTWRCTMLQSRAGLQPSSSQCGAKGILVPRRQLVPRTLKVPTLATTYTPLPLPPRKQINRIYRTIKGREAGVRVVERTQKQD